MKDGGRSRPSPTTFNTLHYRPAGDGPLLNIDAGGVTDDDPTANADGGGGDL